MGRYLNSNADGFGKIVNSEIYVDKTDLVYKLAATGRGKIFLARPRRFASLCSSLPLSLYLPTACETSVA